MTNLNLDGTKIALPQHAERLRAFLAGEHIAPITIDMALTQKCQAACTFCYMELQKNPSDPVPWEVYDQFLEDCVTIGHKPGEGVKAVSLVSDGESTLSKSYYPFIVKAKSLGIDVASGTNGIALKREQLPMLVDNLTYLRINLNAAIPSANSRIMGTPEKSFWTVIDNVKELVRLKRERQSNITIGLQMVMMKSYADQIIPLAKFGATLGVDYLVLKHCTDDAEGRLGVDYAWYRSDAATAIFKEAETYSTDAYSVQVKWNKVKTGNNREYSKCFGTALHLQMSGTGIVAPCGSFFSPEYKDKWIGDIRTTRFKDIWASARYWEVIDFLKSKAFDPRTDCSSLCVQDRTNLALFNLIEKGEALPPASDNNHRNFL